MLDYLVPYRHAGTPQGIRAHLCLDLVWVFGCAQTIYKFLIPYIQVLFEWFLYITRTGMVPEERGGCV